jgi:hypothetical protein
MKTNTKHIKRFGYNGLVAAVTLLLSATAAWSIEYDLTTVNSVSVPGDVGGYAIFANYWEQPAGTGVFDPFLTIENKLIEQGYNTDGASALYMNQTRPHWNTTLKVGSLASVELNGVQYYSFILDANEPGGAKSVLSIDNIRIYTSAMDNTGAVGSDINMLPNLGTLRWALNDPTLNTGGGYNATDWVKLDGNQENVGYKSNGGSGQADMILYVPVASFGNASGSDFVWFYNLNGVKYSADRNLASEAGFEEWRACVSTRTVPDGGFTVGLLGLALAAMGIVARKFA